MKAAGLLLLAVGGLLSGGGDAFVVRPGASIKSSLGVKRFTTTRRPVLSASLGSIGGDAHLVAPALLAWSPPTTLTVANNDMTLSGSQVGGYFAFLALLIAIPFVGGTMDTFRISAFREKRQDFIDAIEAEIAELKEDGDPSALETAAELNTKLQDVYDEIEAERIEDKKNKYMGMNRYWMQLRNDPDADVAPGDIKANRDRIVPGMDGRGFVPGEMAREELKSQGNRYQRRQEKGKGKRRGGRMK